MRAALIGAGQIAKVHLGALAAAPDVQTVGVCDLSPVMAESTADRFGIDAWFTDFRDMLEARRPDVVHIVTPPASHHMIAKTCLLAGCHVLVEKPVTVTYSEFEELRSIAEDKRLWLIEDHNYLFNDAIQEIESERDAGRLGDVRHVDIQICLDLFAPGSRFADRDMPHPALREPAGAVTDFLTHLCYLAQAFIGTSKRFATYARRETQTLGGPLTEFQTMIDGETATAVVGLSGTSQPDSFRVRVQGTRMAIETNLFEVGTVRTRGFAGPPPLSPIRAARSRARQEKKNARRSLRRKLGGGPGPYEGLWRLVALLYKRLAENGEPPIPIGRVDDVNRLVHSIQREVASSCGS